MVAKFSVNKTIHKTQIPTLLIVDNYDKQFAPYQGFAKHVMQETRGIGFGWWSCK